MTTPLERLLKAQIAMAGPLTMADFMSQCLMHPDHGYYTQQTVFGAAGDFITAPEVSQMFGELIGLALAQSWVAQGRPADAIVVELGPGRGTLMADMRRATQSVAGFAELPVHMVETSPQLRALQAAAVPGVVHHDRVEDLPDRPLFLVANEFFDALPVRQAERTPEGWRERQIAVVQDSLTIGLSNPVPLPDLAHRAADTTPGDVVEWCPALPGIMAGLAQRIATHGGAVLIVDYGNWRSLGDTVQAMRSHTYVPVTDTPGLADLTAHVAFEDIARAAPALARSAMTPQGVFLERLGITQRARQLARGLSGAALDAHISAHRRLTHPAEMGNLFKVIGLAKTPNALPPGLDPAAKGI